MSDGHRLAVPEQGSVVRVEQERAEGETLPEHCSSLQGLRKFFGPYSSRLQYASPSLGSDCLLTLTQIPAQEGEMDPLLDWYCFQLTYEASGDRCFISAQATHGDAAEKGRRLLPVISEIALFLAQAFRSGLASRI
jgi:hypothetical protein